MFDLLKRIKNHSDHFYAFAQPSARHHLHRAPLARSPVFLARIVRRDQMGARCATHLAREHAAVQLHQVADVHPLGTREAWHCDFLELKKNLARKILVSVCLETENISMVLMIKI